MTDTMQQLAMAEAALKALADAVAEQIKTVREQMQQALDTSGVTRVSASLPDGTKVATVSVTEPKPSAVVTDRDAFAAWVRETSPHNHVARVVAEVRPAYQKQLLEHATAAGSPVTKHGEVIPGVEIRAARSRGHSVRPVDGGREAIAEAWRSGALAHLGLVQLGPGPAATGEESAA